MAEDIELIQKYLNNTYGSESLWEPLLEDGITGWGTVRGITRALQLEIGGLVVDGVFGDSLIKAVPIVAPGTKASREILALVNSGLRCKGYSAAPPPLPGFFEYGNSTQDAVETLRQDANYPHGGSRTVSPQIWKGLCRMDDYREVPGGDANVRHIQQRINELAGDQEKIGLNPTDGIPSANVTRGIIGVVQVEGRVGVDGLWGPGTASTLPTLSLGSAEAIYDEIAQWGLYLNGFDVPLDQNFTEPIRDAVGEFQDFMCINNPRIYRTVEVFTWPALLVSYGNKSRGQDDISASASIGMDTSTKLNGLTRTFVDANFPAGQLRIKFVGRYLMNTPGGALDKELSPDEVTEIHDAGLGIVPIFQTYGGENTYFTHAQGVKDATDAQQVAEKLGIPTDVMIYFAVDFDAYGDDIADYVLPYFRGINTTIQGYPVGVYGARRVCSEVSQEALAVASYVGNLSSGWSGNIGQKMPENWAYDQYSEFNVNVYDEDGNGQGTIGIDQLVASNRYGLEWWPDRP